MKYKKVFLLKGALTLISIPVIGVVSCGSDKNDVKKLVRNNIKWLDLQKSGGLAGNNAKKNNYALIRDFVFSLTSKNGEFFKFVNKIFATIVEEEKAKEKVKTILQSLDKETLTNLLITMHSKGVVSLESKQIDVFLEIFKLITKQKKLDPRLKYYISFIIRFLQSDGIKDFIKKEGGLFNVIKKIISQTFPDGFRELIKSFEYGKALSGNTADDYAKYIFAEIKNFFNALSNSENLKEAIGLNETPGLDTLFVHLQNNIFRINKDEIIKPLIQKWNQQHLADEKVTTLTPYKTGNNKEKIKLKVSDVRSVIEKTEKNMEISNVPFLNEKGIFNSSLEELKKNLSFLQLVLQQFLLNFSYFDPNEEASTNATKVSATFNKIPSGKSQEAKATYNKLSSMLNKLEPLAYNHFLWKIAALYLENYAGLIYKMINSKFDSENFQANEINKIIELINLFTGKSLSENTNILNDVEAKILIDMIRDGFNKGVSQIESAKSAITKILKMFSINPYISTLFSSLLFGS